MLQLTPKAAQTHDTPILKGHVAPAKIQIAMKIDYLTPLDSCKVSLGCLCYTANIFKSLSPA